MSKGYMSIKKNKIYLPYQLQTNPPCTVLWQVFLELALKSK